LEIAKHPDVQKRLREEIRATEQVIHARGDVDFTATDLDGMPYLSAVIKVSSTFIYIYESCEFQLIISRNQCVIILLYIRIIDKQPTMMSYRYRVP
jgi:hypothetical protein